LSNKLKLEGKIVSKFGICFDISNKELYSKKFVFDYLNTDGKKDLKTISHGSYIRCLHKGSIATLEDTIEKLLIYANDHRHVTDSEAYYVPLFDYWESMSEEFVGEVLIRVLENKK